LKFSRRSFLKSSLVAGLASSLSRPFSLLAGQTTKALPLAEVTGQDVELTTRRAIELIGGIERFVKPGDRVVVKPNASFANPADWGNNTNPEVLAAVCKLCRQAGARKVVAVDYPLFKGAEAPKINGIAEAIEKIPGASLSVLSQEHQFRNIKVPGGVALKEVAVSREVLDADVFINIPVAKAHDAVAASIGLKNLMGVIWDRTAFHTMMDINQAIADLSRVVRPALTVVDMSRIMVTNGPKGPGEVVQPNIVIATPDPVAADAHALAKARFNGRRFRPKQLRYLEYAHQAGLGEINPKKLTLHKEQV
jgi:uncharacterized protein (DUF362 family)